MSRVLDFLNEDVDLDIAPSEALRVARTKQGDHAPTGSKDKGKRRRIDVGTTRSDDHDADDGDEDDGDAEFIAEATHLAHQKAGAKVAKETTKIQTGKVNKKVGGGAASGGGSFQSMGLHPSLLRSLLMRGYNVPTPIQRQAIPAIIEQPPRDVVGMARTGSGKTLAYLVPLLQRLQGRHSTTFGVKSLILCPSRELALQILRVGKDLARGWKSSTAVGGGADGANSASTSAHPAAIRWALIVGGESMDEQFSLMASNPDVVISTPGRLLHLAVEMNLDLKSVEYVVFDEADRLFEMGFAAQLEELLLRLPPQRQTLLFSATLPKSLVEFARAGLQANPKLIRLDADSKISADLRMAFFSVKPTDKEAALLLILRDVIGVPFGEQINASAASSEERRGGRDGSGPGRKRGRGGHAAKSGRTALTGADQLLPHQTIIFCATKHHVEYLVALLSATGYTCSSIYSSMDQAARTLQMRSFREGRSSLLVVTDVAARGIDLPVLEHVVNYDFAPAPRIFVHRVGRTARAGKKGWAWSLVTNAELPFLCDLQLFLGRPLVPSVRVADGSSEAEPMDVHSLLVLGTLPRDQLDMDNEYLNGALLRSDSRVGVALPSLKSVSLRAQKMYERSQGKASQESYRRAKEMTKAGQTQRGEWALAGSVEEQSAIHDVVRRRHAYGLSSHTSAGAGGDTTAAPKHASAASTASASTAHDVATARAALLAKVNAFRPSETVFEVGSKGASPLALLMRERRKTLEGKARKTAAQEDSEAVTDEEEVEESRRPVARHGAEDGAADLAEEDEIESVFDTGKPSKSATEGTASKRISTKAADLAGAAGGLSAPAASKPVKLGSGKYRDPEFYMDYEQKDAKTERGYSLTSGASFVEQARQASFSLTADESRMGTQSQAPNVSRWDAKKKRFVRGDGTGSKNEKYVRTEAGVRLPASFRSGRFDEWRRRQRVGKLPNVGESEAQSSEAGNAVGGSFGGGGAGGPRRKFRHSKLVEPKRLDKLRVDFGRQLKKQRMRASSSSSSADVDEARAAKKGARASSSGSAPPTSFKGAATRPTASTRRGAKPTTSGRGRPELRSAAQIVKARRVAAKRKDKNARPTRKSKR